MMLAGEPSGDLHGAYLAEALRSLRPDVTLFGAGGPLMKEAGVRIEVDLTEKAVIGIWEVVKNLSEFRKTFHFLLRRCEAEKPDAVILIDYPGFNLRFAKAVKRLGIRVIYYISPQVWAWGGWRIPTIRDVVDQMIVVFAFEEIFYKRHGIRAHFVGHPLLDLLAKEAPRREELLLPKGKRLIGLLPGSREREVASLLPIMIEAGRLLTKKLPDLHFLIFQSPNLSDSLYQKTPLDNLPATFVRDADYHYRRRIDFSLVASGTATLENAILGKPMVILYRTSLVTYFLAKGLIQIPYIGLVNVVAGEKIIPECLQYQATPECVAETALSLLKNPGKLERMNRDLSGIREKLGNSGASLRAAKTILEQLHASGAPDKGDNQK